MKNTITQKVYKGLLYGFSLISILIAATIQFYISNAIDNKCDPDVAEYVNPTLIGGGSLVGSVVFCVLWVASAHAKKDTFRRISMFLWTIAVGVGLAAIGASLGQITILSKLKAGECLNTVEINLSALQYSSVALIIAGLTIPHTFSLKSEPVAGAVGAPAIGAGGLEDGEGVPTTSDMKRPLVFL